MPRKPCMYGYLYIGGVLYIWHIFIRFTSRNNSLHIMQWTFEIRNSGLQMSFCLWNRTKLGCILGRGCLSCGKQMLFLNNYFTLDALQVNHSMLREVWGGSLTFTGSLIDYPMCGILLLTLVIKKQPGGNLSSSDKACKIAFCKAKLRGSWMRSFSLETSGTWPWHTCVQLRLNLWPSPS